MAIILVLLLLLLAAISIVSLLMAEPLGWKMGLAPRASADQPSAVASQSDISRTMLRRAVGWLAALMQPAHARCFVTHKWGTLLLKQLIKEYDLPCQMVNHIPSAVPNHSVVVARNVYDSIVSGYLYHKSGHECWVDENGLPNPYPTGGNDWARHCSAWSKLVTTVPFDNRYAHNPNLCEVLVSAPLEIGLGIYTEFALHRFVASPLKLRTSPAGRPGPVLYVCMEDLANVGSQRDAEIKEIRDHLEGVRTARRRLTPKRSHTTWDMVTTEGRKHLLTLVGAIDRKYLNGTLQQAQALFQCVGSS